MVFLGDLPIIMHCLSWCHIMAPVGCGFLFEDGDVNCPSENKSRC